MITTPGIYEALPMSEYLAIPALSASVIKAIDERCPRAAWFDSYMNPKRDLSHSAATDTGSIAHAILLEGSEACCQVFNTADYPNKTGGGTARGWTNDAIKDARDQARAAGLIPMLADDMIEVRSMVGEARRFVESLRATEPAVHAMFQEGGGDSEVTFVWEEFGLLCKLRADRIAKDHGAIADYKTSGMSVEPSHFGRAQMANQAYFISAAWYRRGVHALSGTDPYYVFLAQETDAPYLCSLNGCEPMILELGNTKIDRALDTWRTCIETGVWPSYPNRVCYAEIPNWLLARETEKQTLDQSIDYFRQP